MKYISLFILIVISSSVFYCQVGSVIEYWVRPTAVSSCPLSVSQEQCVTITDLVSNSTNASINDYNNVSVYFLPGVHVPQKEGWIVFGKQLNYSLLSFTASVSGVKGTGITSNHTSIDCTKGSKITLLFLNLVSLSLNNFEIKNCGHVKKNVHFHDQGFLFEIIASISIGIHPIYP